MKYRCTCLLVFLALALNAYATTPDLQTAAQFGVLASTGVTNVDSGTTIRGSVGSAPASPSVTGLTPVMVTGGTLYTTANAVTGQAQTDATAAYGTAAAAPCPATNNLTGQDLGGLSLTSGASNVYCFTSSAGLTGTLTLSGGPSDVFIFKIGSTLITGTNSKVSLIGVSPCNVFWQVGSSATIQVNNDFVGNILALTSITLNGGTLTGRALANTGAVTISGKETILSGCPVPGSSIVLSPVNSSIICGSGSSITETAVVLSNGLPPVVGTSVAFAITGPDSGKSGTATTDAFGIATFTFTASSSLTPTMPDSVVATIGTDASNTTNATCSISNLTPPTVALATMIPGPPKQVVLSVQAPGSGLFSVVVNTATNATVVIPSFDKGTTQVLGVTATKINQSAPSVVGLTVTDVFGNITKFDPVSATITIPAAAAHSGSKSHHAVKFDFDHWEVARFDGIGHTEGMVFLLNGTHGVELLVISVNGSQFRTPLSDGETKKIDISSALFHGHNTVRVAALGDPGSSVDLTISDGPK
jgi:hypothetical protein